MNDASLKAIGKRIQERRKKQGFTQEQIAEKMNVSIQMVSNLERGNKSVRIENLIKLCEILNVSTDYILLGKETSYDLNNIAEQISSLPFKEQKMIEMIIDYLHLNKN